MCTIRPRRAAALLAVLALLLAAVPAAAVPDRAATNETGLGVPFLHSLVAWLAAFWPGTGPAAEPQSISEALGAGLDPDGAPEPESGLPAATPQIGADLDPFG